MSGSGYFDWHVCWVSSTTRVIKLDFFIAFMLLVLSWALLAELILWLVVWYSPSRKFVLQFWWNPSVLLISSLALISPYMCVCALHLHALNAFHQSSQILLADKLAPHPHPLKLQNTAFISYPASCLCLLLTSHANPKWNECFQTNSTVYTVRGKKVNCKQAHSFSLCSRT